MDAFSQLIAVITVTSFVSFQLLFHRVSPWVSARLSRGFLRLGDQQKVEWNSRTVSTFHALLVALFCLYILMFDDNVNQDPVWGDPTLVKINVAITTGYLISDLLLICYYWKAIGDKFFVFHHMAALYAYYYVLGEGMLPYFANFRLLAEFSTPCVNQRWFFEVLGYAKSSRRNVANGAAMAAVFFLVRIAVMPLYYGRMYAVVGTAAYYRLAPGARVAWILPSVCLDLMNVMWMHRIARGCYRMLQGRRSPPPRTTSPKVVDDASSPLPPPPRLNGKTD